MDGTTNRVEGEGDHIWLRYATQFTQDGRTYTIEMGIPVPLGASAEQRARLIQEAETGMDQLAQHVEKRASQIPRRGQVAQGNPAPTPPARPAPTPLPAQSQRPASQPAPLTAPQRPAPAPVGARETIQEPQSVPGGDPVVVPPSRPSLSASMPMSLTDGDLKLPQFIQQIREELNLTPKEAMEILKVKSLSQGIILRDAYEQLRQVVSSRSGNAKNIERKDNSVETGGAGSRAGGATSDMQTGYAQQSAQDERFEGDEEDDGPSASVVTRQAAPPPIQLQSVSRVAADESVRAVRDERPIYIFDEEEAESDEEDDLLQDLDEPPALSTQARVQGRTLINRMRESRGATTANNGRLNALTNVAGSQISDDQFQELIEGLWGITAPRKLKVDQVEALISWAKEDDFVNEVEAVLLLLEEERYARGNR